MYYLFSKHHYFNVFLHGDPRTVTGLMVCNFDVTLLEETHSFHVFILPLSSHYESALFNIHSQTCYFFYPGTGEATWVQLIYCG